ncbi:MAG TPA: phage protease [Candidatus Angelobacter sp.]|nr:phage protease [Candidatus Angelobacter sp.]
MNTPILNRDFSHPADGWYQIESKGEHPNRAAGVVQVIDDEAANAIVSQFNQDAAAGKLRHGRELLIDHEHFSDRPDKESRAYGWLTELRHRADGIYGRVRWSKTGREAVDGGDYRFFSTEYDPKDCQPVGSAIGNRQSAMTKIRPTRLDGLSLTNMNNNRGQKPITNRAAADNPTEKNQMNTIALKLGLAADASEEIVLAEVTRLLNRVTELIPREEENKALHERLAAIDGEQAHTLLDLHGVKDEKIRNRLKPVLMGLKSRDERVAALLDFGFKPEERRSAERFAPRLLNRGEGRPARPEILNPNEQALAQRAEAEIGEYKIRNRCTYAEARNAVRIARPELFGLEKR